MNIDEFMNFLVNNVLLPLLIAIGSAMLIVAKSYIKRIMKSIEAKNDLESLMKLNEMKSTLINEIGIIVDAAVGSNMQLADKMKSENENCKLTNDQMKLLNESAKELIMKALPESLTNENGSLLNIIGGKDKLDAIIEGMLEKYVYEYKIKSSDNKNKTTTTDSPIQSKFDIIKKCFEK